ncbi:MAG: alpha-beta hydrolase superfamily lysophospholipase, partial [Myxococcota bacterium]
MRTTRLITSVALALVVGCSSDTTGSDGTGTEATGASTATGTATTGDSGGGTAGTDTAGTDTGGTDTGGIDTAGTGNARWLEACPADEPEMRMVDVGQVTLHVACQGSGPTVILLHGFPEFWYGWHKVIPELAAKGFRVVVPDQRGYNLSDKPAEQADYGIEHLVADIDGLIDAVSDEPVVLVGHDWGGVVAWASASVLSDKIDRLVIANG